MKFIVLVIVGIHVFLSLASAWRESLTYDEIANSEEGIAILTKGIYSDPYIPPLTKILTAVPIFLGTDRLISLNPPNQRFIASRSVTIAFSVFLLVSLYLVTKRWFGKIPALLALILGAFEPNILGHNHYLTSDVPLAFLIFVSFAFFIELIAKPTVRNALLSGILFGLAGATKLTAPIFLVPSAMVFMYQRGAAVAWIKTNYRKIILLLGVAFAVVWATYEFRSGIIIAERTDASRLSARLVKSATDRGIPFVIPIVTYLQTTPVPLGDYVALIKNSLIRGSTAPHVFFEGSDFWKPRWYFMPVTFLLKTPVPLLAFSLVTVTGLIRYSRRKKSFVIACAIPILIILVVTSVLGFMPQIRYALPVYPFVIILASASVEAIKSMRQKFCFILLLGWYMWGTLSMYPHFISYANELAGPRELRFTRFTDSNIDWGQSIPDFVSYVRKTRPTLVVFSYFGRDDAGAYGLVSPVPWGSYTFDNICAFHPVMFPHQQGETLTAVSISNWYSCRYYLLPRFSKDHIKTSVGDSILIF